jgi:hypothetical protein
MGSVAAADLNLASLDMQISGHRADQVFTDDRGDAPVDTDPLGSSASPCAPKLLASIRQSLNRNHSIL